MQAMLDTVHLLHDEFALVMDPIAMVDQAKDVNVQHEADCLQGTSGFVIVLLNWC